jgi:hypothetical protein
MRFYHIEHRAVGTNYPWTPISETEYTLKEAREKLRMLEMNAQRYYGSPFVFRKKFIYSAPVQTLSVRNHRHA